MIKKQTFFLVALCFTANGMFSQTWQWAKSGGSSITPSGFLEEGVRDLSVAPNGDVYVISPIGGAFPNVDGNELEANDYTLTKVDNVLASFDCEGNYRWSKVIGGWSDDYLDRVATDTLGHVYCVGKIRPPYYSQGGDSEPTRFDNDTIIHYNPNPNEGKRETFILQYSSEGDLNWLRMPQPEDFETGGEEQVLSLDLSVTPNGEAYWLVQVGPGTYADGAFVNEEEKGEYIFHYDVEGNFLEAIPIDFDFVLYDLDNFEMTRDPHSGRFYIGGYHNFLSEENPIVMGGEPVTHSMYIGAFDAQGNFLWKVENTDIDSGNFAGLPVGTIDDIAIDEQGYLYVSGGTYNGDHIGGVEITTEQNSFGYYSAVPVVMKFDSEGNLLWENHPTYSDGDHNDARSIVLNGKELAITGGYYRLTWDDIALGNEYVDGYGGVYFARLNKESGSLIDFKAINNTTSVSTNSGNLGLELSSTPHREYILGGSVGYDLKFGDAMVYNTGGPTDFFVAKYGTGNCDCELPESNFSYATNENGTVGFSFEGTSAYNELEWSFGDGETSAEDAPQHAYADEEGTYWVCATVYDDCGYDTYCKEISLETQGVNGLLGAKLLLYPNPARDYVQLQAPKALSYAIVDLRGKQVKTGKAVSGQTSISLEGLSPGLYMVRLTAKDGSQRTLKLVRE